MTHIRTRVVEYVKNRLMGQTTAGTRVFDHKLTKTMPPFPAINISAVNDRLDELRGENPVVQNRVLTLQVDVEVLAMQDGWKAAMDDICLKVEQLIDVKLGGGIPELESCIYDETQIVGNADGEKITAIAVMTWNVKYVWEETPVLTTEEMDDLKLLHGTWDMSSPNNGTVDGPDGQIDAEDIIDLGEN